MASLTMKPEPAGDLRPERCDDLLQALREACAGAFAGTAIVVAYAYGSRVWGAPRADSDVDVGYYLAFDATPRRLPLREELRMAGVLSGAIGFEVDLRDLGDAPLALRGRVLEDGRRVYCGDEVARVDLERDLLARYHDYKAELEALRALRIAGLAARGS